MAYNRHDRVVVTNIRAGKATIGIIIDEHHKSESESAFGSVSSI